MSAPWKWHLTCSVSPDPWGLCHISFWNFQCAIRDRKTNKWWVVLVLSLRPGINSPSVLLWLCILPTEQALFTPKDHTCYTCACASFPRKRTLFTSCRPLPLFLLDGAISCVMGMLPLRDVYYSLHEIPAQVWPRCICRIEHNSTKMGYFALHFILWRAIKPYSAPENILPHTRNFFSDQNRALWLFMSLRCPSPMSCGLKPHNLSFSNTSASSKDLVPRN